MVSSSNPMNEDANFQVMGVGVYDDSMLSKFKKFVENTIYASTDQALIISGLKGDEPKDRKNLNEKIPKADQVDQVKLPLISIYRPLGITYNTALRNQAEEIGRGRMLRPLEMAKLNARSAGNYSEGDNVSPISVRGVTLNSVAVSLTYQIDIWSRRKDVTDDLTCNLIFWILNEPYVLINDPYNLFEDGERQSTGEVIFPIILENDIPDNSEESEFSDVGRIFRNTVTLDVPDARIFLPRPVKRVIIPSITYEVIECGKENPDVQDNVNLQD